jgi:DNA-binding LytR/AlgR family response regulator
MIRVAIIDDDPTSRKELVQIIGKAPDITKLFILVLTFYFHLATKAA